MTDTKQHNVEERLHDDDAGLVIPFSCESDISTLKEDEDQAGIQHPGRNFKQMQEQLQNATKVCTQSLLFLVCNS